MRLILVRHGITDDNLSEITQGRDGKPLNARGEQQADALARRLSVLRVDGIYSSDMSRALGTARKIASYHSHATPIVDRRLRERFSGDHGGRPHGEFDAAVLKSKVPVTHYRPPNGESLVDVLPRAAGWHRDIARQHYGHLLVVVTHGHWLQAYLGWLVHGVVDERSKQFKHYNTGMSVVDLHEAKPRIIMLNDISHLG